MKIDLIYIAYNRLQYTQITLPELLKDPNEDFSLTIWDNGSTDGTREYISSLKDPRISRTVFASENVRLHGAVNDLVKNSSAELIGMIFDDILVTPGWTRPLAKAHADIPEFGMIGSWHFPEEDFDYEIAKNKIKKYGEHQVIQHPWTGVGAGLVKLKTLREFGPLPSSRTTNYWVKMALKGYVNGYYYPIILADHLDDPRAPHTMLKTEEDFEKHIPTTVKCNGITSFEGWIESLKKDALIIQTATADPRYYIGWRPKLRRLRNRIRRYLKLNKNSTF